ncbi:uncharacterized protein LOC123314707 [Coccinella septempunctata]|uniref:uncharacterized protein LOC123314707 n=1 Tax=Coccinella septempunctata TaxID=41139 RepID=UPI001D0792D9|nr:uncharacterized protein LOC123314707 [Coccinella septempunctata]
MKSDYLFLQTARRVSTSKRKEMLGSPTKKSTRHIVLCINYIINIYANGKSWIITVDDEFNIDFPVMRMDMKRVIKPSVYLQKPDLYIINDENKTTNQIIQFIKTMKFNRKTKFILISKDISEKTLKDFATNFITRVVFLNPTTGTLSNFKPYRHRTLNNIDTNLETLDVCSDISIESDTNIPSVGDIDRHDGIFCDGTPNIWTGSEISVMYYFSPPYTMCLECENKGVELEAHLIIMELMNLTGNYRQKIIDVLDRKTFNELPWEKFDILLNSYPFEGLDYTAPFVHDYYSWFVPSPKEIKKWKYICIIFGSETWIALTFSVIFVSVIWYFMNFLHKPSRRPIYVLHNLIVILKLTVEEDFVFEIHHVHQLILFASICFFVSVVSLIYKTEYTTVLSKNMYEHDVNSLKDAMEKGLYVGLPVFRKKLLQNSPETRDYLRKYYVSCDFSTACLEQAAKQRNMITATIDRYFNFVQKKFMDEDGRSTLKKLHPPLLNVQLVEVLRQGHVLTPFFSKYLGYLRAHGFVNYLMAKYDYQAAVPPLLPSGMKKFSLEHVQAPLIFLLTGIIIATATFLVELRHP